MSRIVTRLPSRARTVSELQDRFISEKSGWGREKRSVSLCVAGSVAGSWRLGIREGYVAVVDGRVMFHVNLGSERKEFSRISASVLRSDDDA